MYPELKAYLKTSGWDNTPTLRPLFSRFHPGFDDFCKAAAWYFWVKILVFTGWLITDSMGLSLKAKGWAMIGLPLFSIWWSYFRPKPERNLLAASLPLLVIAAFVMGPIFVAAGSFMAGLWFLALILAVVALVTLLVTGHWVTGITLLVVIRFAFFT